MASGSDRPRPGHPIQVVARRTGLSQDVIRVWERRYAAVTPFRTETNRRRYTDDDVERLLLLARVTQAGRRIGDVAALGLAELRAMALDDREAAARVAAPPVAPGRPDAQRHLADALDAVRLLDSESLRACLESASIELSRPVLLERLLEPLMRAIGTLWQDGAIRIAHEHLATAIVRTFVGALQDATPAAPGAPELVVAAPAGQRHELGGLLVAVSASADGWRVSYCGSDLPADEIAAVARARGAAVVALSLVHPADDPRLAAELRRLRRLLGEAVEVVAGGAAAPGYAAVLREVGARLIPDVATLRRELRTLRGGAPD